MDSTNKYLGARIIDIVAQQTHLKPSETIELFKNETNDPGAREKIILGNMKLIVAIMKKLSIPENVKQEDVFFVGMEYLIRAVDKFDYTKGFQFSTFAYQYCKPAMLNFIDYSSTAISMSASGFSRYRKEYVSAVLEISDSNGEITEENIRKITGWSADKSMNIYRLLGSRTPLSVDYLAESDDGKDYNSLQLNSGFDEEQSILDKLVREDAFAKLTERETTIITMLLNEKTQNEISKTLNVSRPQISREVKQLRLKLQELMGIE